MTGAFFFSPGNHDAHPPDKLAEGSVRLNPKRRFSVIERDEARQFWEGDSCNHCEELSA